MSDIIPSPAAAFEELANRNATHAHALAMLFPKTASLKRNDPEYFDPKDEWEIPIKEFSSEILNHITDDISSNEPLMNDIFIAGCLCSPDLATRGDCVLYFEEELLTLWTAFMDLLDLREDDGAIDCLPAHHKVFVEHVIDKLKEQADEIRDELWALHTEALLDD